MKLKLTRFMLFILILINMLILSGCFKKENIKVAYVGSLTGRYSEIGVSSRNAIKMAVGEWNKKGGINGRQIELIVEDDTGDPDVGIIIDDKLIKQGYKFFLGHLTSSMAPAIFDKINDDILFVSPTMSTSELSIKGDNFIRTIPPCSHQSRLLADKAISDGYKNCFIIFDSQNGIYTKDVMNNFIKYMKDKNPNFIYSSDSIQKPTNEVYTSVSQKIKKYNPDMVLIITNGIDFAKIAQQLKRHEFYAPLFGPRWASTEDVIILGGKSVEGAIFTAGDQSEKNLVSKNNSFYENYKKLYGEKPVNFIPIFAYDAANVLFVSMSQLNEITPNSVKSKIIEIGKFEGVNETFLIDQFGDANRSVNLITINDGIFTNVKK